MPLLLISCLLFMVTCSNATIYTQLNADHQQFTDSPAIGFNPIQLQEINIYQSSTATKKSTTNVTTLTATNRYSEFSLLTPQNQQSFYNQPNIPVRLQIQPTLVAGDFIELVLDGQILQNLTTDHTSLDNPDPGEHVLQAKLLTADKQILKMTEKVTFFVHRVGN